MRENAYGCEMLLHVWLRVSAHRLLMPALLGRIEVSVGGDVGGGVSIGARGREHHASAATHQIAFGARGVGEDDHAYDLQETLLPSLGLHTTNTICLN